MERNAECDAEDVEKTSGDRGRGTWRKDGDVSRMGRWAGGDGVDGGCRDMVEDVCVCEMFELMLFTATPKNQTNSRETRRAYQHS